MKGNKSKIFWMIGFGFSCFLHGAVANLTIDFTNPQAQHVITPLGKTMRAVRVLEGNRSYFALLSQLPNQDFDFEFGQMENVMPGISYIQFNIAGGLVDETLAITFKPDGKILVAGRAEDALGMAHFAVAQFLENGQLDITFGQVGTAQAGTMYIPFSIIPEGSTDVPTTIVFQADGKIVVGGSATDEMGIGHFALVRFLPDGALDSSFGQVGTARAGTMYLPLTIAGGGDDGISNIQIQGNGRLFVQGYSQGVNGEYALASAQLLENGQLDQDFGGVPFPAIAGTTYEFLLNVDQEINPPVSLIPAG